MKTKRKLIPLKARLFCSGLKSTAVLLALLMTLLCGLTVPASAESCEITESVQKTAITSGTYTHTDETGMEYFYAEYSGYNSAPDYLIDASSVTLMSLRETILSGLENVQTSIDISQYKMTFDDVQKIYFEVINNEPQLFYVTNKLSGGVMGGLVTNLSPGYDDVSTIDVRKAELEKARELALSVLPAGLSEAETVLAVSNYLACSFEYDMTLTGRSIYDMLVTGTAVCEGYARAMIYLLREFDIEAIFVGSDLMKHAWNLVKVDGEWYHADATFDDPTADRLGRAYHENILLSDIAFSENHPGWNDGYPAAESTLYDDAWWRDIISNMSYYDGEWYYSKGVSTETSYVQRIFAYNPATKAERIVHTYKGVWSAGGNSYWPGTFLFAGLYEGHLIYNTTDSIYRVKPDGTGNTLIFKESALSGTQAIYGMRIKGNIVEYALAGGANSAPYKTKTFILDENADMFIPKRGDANCDGSVDVLDIVKVRDHILGSKILNAWEYINANIDADSAVSVSDLVAIRDHILGTKLLD